jgi:hypothetical protein
MPSITFEATTYDINGWTILRLPDEASKQLPSRSQVHVSGTINGSKFSAALEPDGSFGHWLNIADTPLKDVKPGDKMELEIEATANKAWPEPVVPADVQKGIVKNPETIALWARVTPMARWEWLRWINSTNNADTRAKRIIVSVDKLKNGLRRPCCFNRSMCCVPQVAKSGVLLEPAAAK